MTMSLILIYVLLLMAVSVRAVVVLRKPPVPAKRNPHETCTIAVFLGSGGHTTEALTLLTALDFKRYAHRIYVISEGDNFSAQKSLVLETQKGSLKGIGTHSTLIIPRARRVHQPLVTTPPSALWSLLVSMTHLTFKPLFTRHPFADALLLNGPGTCVTLSIAAMISRFLGIPTPRLIYVETFARVNRLSLSGKLLRYFVDTFIVQWPSLLKDKGRGEYHGWLL